MTEINFIFFFDSKCVNHIFSLSLYKFLSPTHFFSFCTIHGSRNAKTPTAQSRNKPNRQRTPTNLPTERKNLALLQQTNQIFQKALEISREKNINSENLQHAMENISTWSEDIKQSNKVLHNYMTTLRDRCHRIQDQLNQPQNNLVKDWTVYKQHPISFQH